MNTLTVGVKRWFLAWFGLFIAVSFKYFGYYLAVVPAGAIRAPQGRRPGRPAVRFGGQAQHRPRRAGPHPAPVGNPQKGARSQQGADRQWRCGGRVQMTATMMFLSSRATCMTTASSVAPRWRESC